MNLRTLLGDLFPCPFCRSAAVVRTGGSDTFEHYRCVNCSETWTAMRAASRPAKVPGQRSGVAADGPTSH
jgi:hypothetical protein